MSAKSTRCRLNWLLLIVAFRFETVDHTQECQSIGGNIDIAFSPVENKCLLQYQLPLFSAFVLIAFQTPYMPMTEPVPSCPSYLWPSEEWERETISTFVDLRQVRFRSAESRMIVSQRAKTRQNIHEALPLVEISKHRT